MTLDTARDIAFMFLAVHAAIACVVPLAIAFLLASATIAANRKTREVMPRLQGYAQRLADGTEAASDRVTGPILTLEGRVAQARGMWRQSTNPLRRSGSHGGGFNQPGRADSGAHRNH